MKLTQVIILILGVLTSHYLSNFREIRNRELRYWPSITGVVAYLITLYIFGFFS